MATTEKSGHLLKEGGSGPVKGWKARWFVLSNGQLSYYKSRKDPQPVGTLPLANTIVSVSTSRDHALSLSGPGLPRVYNLAALSQAEQLEWIAALRAAAVGGPGSPDSGSPMSPRNAAEHVWTRGSRPRVSLGDFEVVRVIGAGSFGKVVKVKLPKTGETFAMKALNKQQVRAERMVENTKLEKSILQTIDHPFVVKLHYAFQTRNHLYLLLDLLPGGELFMHMKRQGCFTVRRSLIYTAEIASALTHIHALDVAYRDLKPENVVLDGEGHACLTDFGIAKRGLRDGQVTYTFCGTPEYIAPEILKNAGHGKPVDWWALGILLYEMLCGLPPFYSENVKEMYDWILTRELVLPDTIPADAALFLRALLTRDPAQRLQGEAVLRHPFFKEIDWKRLLQRGYNPLQEEPQQQ